MMVFWSRDNNTDPNDTGAREVGRIWIQDGRIHASGSSRVLSIAQEPLKLTFGGEVDPATDPEGFLDGLAMRYGSHTYFFVTEFPDEERKEME
jgi:hypothetical protein